MLTMLTHLRDTVFATGPLNLCLETPGPFSPWQCQSVKTTVRSCPTVYLIPSFVPDMLFGSKDGYFPTVPIVSTSTASNACQNVMCACACATRCPSPSISQEV